MGLVDEEIVLLLKNENADGGLLLLKSQYKNLIIYIIRGVLYEYPQDIEECENDVYLKIWKSIDTYDPSKSTLKTFIICVARNTAINRLKSVKRYEQHFGDNLGDAQSTASDVCENLISQENAEALKSKILSLSDTERDLIARKYYYMQSTKQIASETNKTIRSVESKLLRIKKKLKKALDKEGN